MTEKDLLSAIDYREQRASGGDIFEEEQRKALRYYFGEPFGNEQDGESHVVMREVYGTIEWIKPMLMKIFFGAEKVVQFKPKNGDDVQQAEQETEYVNHIITDQNDGFLLFMEWFTDALLLKNGYLFAYWDERIDVTESVYHDVDVPTLTLLMEEKDTEILEAEEDGIDDFDGEPTYKIRVRTKETHGQVKVKSIPPERVRIDGNHNSVSLKDCPYVRYSERVTISSLREQGFEVPDDIQDESESIDNDAMEIIRSKNQKLAGSLDTDANDPDPSSREVEVHTLFIRVDFDGDGLAELRRVIKVGKKILYNEVEGIVAMASLTPTVIAHRHQGMSIADAVMDIQEIKSMLARGYLNNIYLANNGRYFVDDDRVNMDDFLVSRPGGVVRVTGGVSNAVQPFQHPVLGSTIVQAIEYMDNVLENRTGASPRVLQGQSFDGNAINKTATGINQIMSSVMARIELIARIFAETGVQDLYRIVHALSLKHHRKQDVFELMGQYVPVDPQQWEKRTQMTCQVGLGVGDKSERIQALQMLITAQMNMLPMGLTSPKEIRNSLVKLTMLAGFKDVENFWPAPPNGEAPQAPPAPPDPAVQADQAKLELDKEKLAHDAQIAERKLKIEAFKAEKEAEREQARLSIDGITKLATAALSSDDAARAAGMIIEGDEEPSEPGEPDVKQMLATLMQRMEAGNRRPIAVRHVRDEQGNLSHSEPVYE